MPPPADAPKPTPDSLFAAWLARHEAGEEADFEAVCREHPEQAAQHVWGEAPQCHLFKSQAFKG